MAVAVRVLLAALLGLYWSSSLIEGITFFLRGVNISNTGNGSVLITDINPNGDNNEDALICRSEERLSFTRSRRGDWYLHPTQMSTDEADRIKNPKDSDPDPRGWIRNRLNDSEGHRVVRLKRASDTAKEGVFTCNITGDINTPRYLGIYYPVSLSVSIGVVSGREGTFRVTCTATGGTLSTSSLTGPGLGSGGLQLQAEGSIGRTGQNTYSVTSDTLLAQSNGSNYICTAMNNVSSPKISAVLAVAGDPTLTSLDQISPTAVRVMWSPPSGGATVTGYVVHYRTNSSVGTKSSSSTSTDIAGLTSGATYTISVEATSQHLSGESEEINIELKPPPAAPSGVMVDGVDDISVRVSWQTVDDADRYNVTFTEELGQGLCIFNIHITSVSFDAPSTSASIGVGRMLAKDDTNMLRAYTTYSITMVAESDMTGSSENSVAITVTTAQIRAAVAPRNVMATGLSSTAISIQWDGLDPCRHVNGLIVLYRVQYTEVASGVVQSTDEAGMWNVTDAEISLTGLTPFTSYYIQVAAVNEEGDVGLYSDHLLSQTMPAQPQVTKGTTTSTSIALSWTSAGSEVDSYEVMWTSDVCTDDVDEGSATITETSYIIEDLREGTSYTITVSVTNSAGASPSDSVTGETEELAPFAAPTSVSVSAVSSSTITVQWGAVDCIHRNGDITGYIVQYRVVGSGSTQIVSVSGGRVTEASLSHLMSSTTYSIQVAAENSAGIGEFSDPKSQLTLVGAPFITVMTSVTSNTIPLTWTSAGSIVNSYEIEWIYYGGECPDVRGGSATVTGAMTSYTIEGLEEHITYSITVTATNNLGCAISEIVTVRTSDSTPSGPPTSVSATSISTSITVQWGAVDCIHRNGDITGYLVQYGVVENGSKQAVTISGGSTTEATISSLMSSTAYLVRVAAENSAGIGVYSDYLIVHTKSVYLSLNNDIIPTHGYVMISDIGSTDDTALICHTNRPAAFDSNGYPHSGGDWFGLDNSRVDGDNVPGFMRNRGPMMVRLLRNTATDPPSEGIYHCEIMTAGETVLTLVYVGLYSSGGEVTVQSNVQFIVDSDLNGAIPQFTLTCISIGGPATTISWTRDSRQAPGEKLTVLDNATTAQYTHTLTVTGRLEGLYTCTVANDKPSNDSAKLNVQAPSPPSGVGVSQIGLGRVLVSWTPPSGEPAVTGYVIYYQRDGGQRLSQSAGPTANNATISGLIINVGVTYSITMVATSSTVPSTETPAQTITIIVMALPAPVVSISPASEFPTAGQTYSLTCSVQVVQHLLVEPSIEWTRQDGTVLNTSSGYSLQLNFNPLRISDSSHYTCRANITVTGAGSVSGNISKDMLLTMDSESSVAISFLGKGECSLTQPPTSEPTTDSTTDSGSISETITDPTSASTTDPFASDSTTIAAFIVGGVLAAILIVSVAVSVIVVALIVKNRRENLSLNKLKENVFDRSMYAHKSVTTTANPAYETMRQGEQGGGGGEREQRCHEYEPVGVTASTDPPITMAADEIYEMPSPQPLPTIPLSVTHPLVEMWVWPGKVRKGMYDKN